MIGPFDVLKDVVLRLEKEKIDYFLVGSLASMYYGKPRYTNDIDLVLELNPYQVDKFAKLFPIEEYYCPPLEILSDEVVHRGQFNLIHQKSQIKIDIVITKKSEFSQSEFLRRKEVEVAEGLSIFIASPEDVIIKKLDFYREGGSEKHLTDIRGILAETSVDQSYLNSWIERFGLQNEWKKI